MARADRVAVILDTASYFEAVAGAIESAERTVFIVGWDVHSRAPLRRGNGRDETLATVLAKALRNNPDLHVRVLAWDYSLL